MSLDPPTARERAWAPGKDLLLLFTDGISDARNRLDVRLGEEPILDLVQRQRSDPPATIVDGVFGVLAAHTGDIIRRDDLTLLVARA
jgi:serine phosphatase RsbU (regulator of sigma subunit)